MKTQLCTFLVLFLFVFTQRTYSQTEIGLKVGSNISGLNNSGLKSDIRPAYMLGIYSRFLSKRKISGQVELRYSYESLEQNALLTVSKHTSHMLRIPLSISYAILPRINMHLGPDLGFILSSNNELIELKGPIPTSYRLESSSRLHVGLAMGMNVELGRTSSLGIRYYRGLNKAIRYSTFFGKNYQVGVYLSTRLFALGE